MTQHKQGANTLAVNTESIEEFKASLRGELISPDSNEYNDARTIYNAMIDKSPALIAKCANVADVIASVNFGRENDLKTSIRSGGHSRKGFALVVDGLVIDLSPMKAFA